MTAELVIFVPRSERDAEANLKQFIEFGRSQLTTYGEDLPFNEHEWDISDYVKLKGVGNKRIRLRFYKQASLSRAKPEALLEPYLSFAKAYMRYINAMRPSTSFSFTLSALRAVHDAIVAQGATSPTKIDATTLNRATQITKEIYSASTAYGIGTHIQNIADFLERNRLTTIAVNGWKQPLKRISSIGRVGPEFDENRSAKLPSEAALDALPKVFRLADEPTYIVVASIAALLCAAPDRINEVLILPELCEVHDKNKDGADVFGLRWWPAKGAHPMIKWVVPSMKDVVIEALKKIRNCTSQAREVARWYEANPKSVYLLPEYEHLRNKPLLKNSEVSFILFGKETHRGTINGWYKMNGIKTTKIDGLNYVRFADIETYVLAQLPREFPWLDRALKLKYSDALFVVNKNALAAEKASWVATVQSVSVNQINNRLGPNLGSKHVTIFERYGFTEPDGSPIAVTTHQFRHYLNTLAQAGGLSQLDIAKWSGRKNVHQNSAYDHVSASELVLKIRNALGDDRQMFGPLAELPKRIVIHRDEFARLKIPTAHTTEFGVCIHDYTMAPCQLHADCLNCSEQVCIKGDEVRDARIRQELQIAEKNLAAAEKAEGDGYFGAGRWVDHHRLTTERLTQLCSMLDDPHVPVGSVIQLSNLPVVSRIEQAGVTRAALECAPQNQRPDPAADAACDVLAMMESFDV